MTEAEWLACTDPTPMLGFLGSKACDRKLRLFACACCRRVWDRLTDPRSRAAIEVAERFADGTAGKKELESADKAACFPDARRASFAALAAATPLHIKHAAFSAAACAAYYVVVELAFGPEGPNKRAKEAEEAIQCNLLRDIFGPRIFRPVRVERAWLAWNDGTIPKLAQAVYEDRAFDRMPVLADALEEAGCADAAILDHCRSPGPHVRGCWVVDLLLGKT